MDPESYEGSPVVSNSELYITSDNTHLCKDANLITYLFISIYLFIHGPKVCIWVCIAVCLHVEQ